MKNKRLIIFLLVSVVLLLIPLLAMLFTDEVYWSVGDFVLAGVFLTGIGLMCEFVLKKVKQMKYRIAICFALFVVFLLVWAEIAVGITETLIKRL